MAKKITTNIERTYTIPLRKEFRKVANWKQTKKAVSAVKVFLKKHMKSENVKLGASVNEKLWKHGIKNPPHHIKVTVTKDDKGEVKAELFGVKKIVKEDQKSSKKANPVKEFSIKKEESKVEAVKIAEVKPESKKEDVKSSSEN